jgi:hypothetical protein
LGEAGFVVFRRFFDPVPLAVELDGALRDGISPTQPVQRFAAGNGTVSLQYVPMMCERTPVSLDLTSLLASVAEDLLQRAVLPGRAKGTKYLGDTSWHRDSELDITSLGCIAYLDRLTAATGALQVLSLSHTNRTIQLPAPGCHTVVTIDSEPGDVIVLDEHLVHGSSGGRERRQWRVDFVIDPADSEIDGVRQWFAQSVPDERGDVGYDARLYPSYGEYWRARNPGWAARVADLGIPARRAAAGQDRTNDRSRRSGA